MKWSIERVGESENSYWTCYLCALLKCKNERSNESIFFRYVRSIMVCFFICEWREVCLCSFSENQMRKQSICFKEFMIPCLPIPLSLSVYFFLLDLLTSIPLHSPFYRQLAKLATFHMRFHFTYYIHIVNRWNMVCFPSSHILLSGRDRLLSFFSSSQKSLRNIECHKIVFPANRCCCCYCYCCCWD